MRTGDEDQRYEVSYLNGTNKRCIIGWSETLDGAKSFAKGVDLHPVMHSPKIKDRKNKKEVKI